MNTFISKHIQFIFTSLIQCIFMYFGRLLWKLIEVFLFSFMSTRRNWMVFWKTFQIMEEPFSLDQVACVRTCPPLATQLIILLCFSSTHLDNIFIFPYIFPSTYLIYHIFHISHILLHLSYISYISHILLHLSYISYISHILLHAPLHLPLVGV